MKKIFLVSLFSLFLTGCFSGRSPNPSFYLLEQQSGKEISSKKISVLVEPIKLPALVDKPQIVLKEENSPEVTVSEFNRWGEPLSNMIRQTLIADLNTYLPNAFIKPDNYDTSGRFDYTLLIEVDRFIGEKKSFAAFDVWWTLRNANGKIIKREKSNFYSSMEESYSSYVEAQGYNIDELTQKIAHKLSNK